jgi:hypothetical protein
VLQQQTIKSGFRYLQKKMINEQKNCDALQAKEICIGPRAGKNVMDKEQTLMFKALKNSDLQTSKKPAQNVQ